jgi:WD40 repeat protein
MTGAADNVLACGRPLRQTGSRSFVSLPETGSIPIHGFGNRYDQWDVAFTADGKHVVRADRSSGVDILALHDVETGKEVVRHQLSKSNGDGEQFKYRCFSPDAKVLATSHWQEIKLWDVPTATLKAVLKGQQEGVRLLVFSPDGQTLASYHFGGVVELWEVATGKEICTIQGQFFFRALRFTPDGKRLISLPNGAGAIYLWDAATVNNLANSKPWREVGVSPFPLIVGSSPWPTKTASRCGILPPTTTVTSRRTPKRLEALPLRRTAELWPCASRVAASYCGRWQVAGYSVCCSRQQCPGIKTLQGAYLFWTAAKLC